MKIKKVHELNESVTNTPEEIIDEIDELTSSFENDNEEELKRRLYKISDLIFDLKFTI